MAFLLLFAAILVPWNANTCPMLSPMCGARLSNRTVPVRVHSHNAMNLGSQVGIVLIAFPSKHVKSHVCTLPHAVNGSYCGSSAGTCCLKNKHHYSYFRVSALHISIVCRRLPRSMRLPMPHIRIVGQMICAIVFFLFRQAPPTNLMPLRHLL